MTTLQEVHVACSRMMNAYNDCHHWNCMTPENIQKFHAKAVEYRATFKAHHGHYPDDFTASMVREGTIADVELNPQNESA